MIDLMEQLSYSQSMLRNQFLKSSLINGLLNLTKKDCKMNFLAQAKECLQNLDKKFKFDHIEPRNDTDRSAEDIDDNSLRYMKERIYKLGV
jgi:hypothetical protein